MELLSAVFTATQELIKIEKNKTQVIDETVNNIRDHVQGDKCLTTLFKSTLFHLAKKGQVLAKSLNTPTADQYSTYRGEQNGPDCEIYTSDCTSLLSKTTPNGEENYEDLVLKQLEPHLQAMGMTPTGSKHTTRKVVEVFHGLTSTLSVEILDENDSRGAAALNNSFTFEEMQKITGLTENKDLIKRKFTHLLEVLRNFEKKKTLLERHPELNTRLDFRVFHTWLMNRVTNKSNIDSNDIAEYKTYKFVLATLNLPVNGTLLPVGRFLSAVKLTKVEEGRYEIDKSSASISLTADPFLLSDIIEETGKLFSRAILWNERQSHHVNLQAKVALMTLYLSLGAPFEHGNDVISNWIENSVYHYHGYKNIHRAEGYRNSMLEPIATLSPQRFIERHQKYTVITSPLEIFLKGLVSGKMLNSISDRATEEQRKSLTLSLEAASQTLKKHIN